jgi:DNA-binding beta-propeller fold protein YncE
MLHRCVIFLCCALPALAVAEDLPLGAATSRIDYQSIDPAARRLYIAEMGTGRLLVVDLTDNRLAASLPGFPKTTGVLAVPELHRVYVSVPGAGVGPSLGVALGKVGLSSGSGAVAVLESDTLKEIARLPAGLFPDGIAYDPVDRRVFVTDEMGGAVTAIDADGNRVLGRIDLGGEVGNVRYDPVSARVYAPVQSRNQLAVIDPVSLRVTAKYELSGGEHPHGLLIAPGAAIGYVACDEDDRLLIVDLASGAVLDRQPLGHDPDVLDLDADAHRLYVASESGTLSSFDVTHPAAPSPLGEAMIGENAHSVAVDPRTHLLYFPLADHAGKAVLRVMRPPS